MSNVACLLVLSLYSTIPDWIRPEIGFVSAADRRYLVSADGTLKHTDTLCVLTSSGSCTLRSATGLAIPVTCDVQPEPAAQRPVEYSPSGIPLLAGVIAAAESRQPYPALSALVRLPGSNFSAIESVHVSTASNTALLSERLFTDRISSSHGIATHRLVSLADGRSLTFTSSPRVSIQRALQHYTFDELAKHYRSGDLSCSALSNNKQMVLALVSPAELRLVKKDGTTSTFALQSWDQIKAAVASCAALYAASATASQEKELLATGLKDDEANPFVSLTCSHADDVAQWTRHPRAYCLAPAP